MQLQIRVLALAAFALLWAGCGGGGSSPSPTVAPTVAPSSAPTGPVQPSGPTLVQSTDWVTFSHDMERSGMQPSAGGITAANVAQLQLLWIHSASFSYDVAGPIAAGGIVYAADVGGNVVALNALTGAVIWQRSLNAEVKMTPALYDGRLFVATEVDTTPTSQSTLFALNPATGSLLWQRSINGGVHGSPVAIAGRLYVPVAIGDPGFCHPGGIYVFDEQSGAAGFEWQTEPNAGDDGGAVWSAVTYDGSRLLFGSGNTCQNASPNANAFVSISTLATLNFVHQTANPLTDDDVGGSVFEQNGIAYVSAKNAMTYAFDPTSGAIRWSKSLGAADGQGGFSTPAMTASTLILSGGYAANPHTSPVGTQYGMLYGLDPATGAQRWKVTGTAPFTSQVATTADLAFTNIDANLDDIDPATGRVVWSAPLVGDSRAQPVIAGGEVFAADESGRLYAYGVPSAANAALRRTTAASWRALPRNHVVPFVDRSPKYCRLR